MGYGASSAFRYKACPEALEGRRPALDTFPQNGKNDLCIVPKYPTAQTFFPRGKEIKGRTFRNNQLTMRNPDGE
jgi:hypothetical protein